jgi:5-methylcytosine-specific restriction endonuclease McrA
MEQSKACIDCKQVKPLTEFLKDKYKKSGFKARCLPCGRIKNGFKGSLDAPRNNRSKIGEAKSPAQLYKDWVSANPDKRQKSNLRFRNNPKNKQIHAEKMRKYRLDNPDAYQNWVKNNPEKANANWNRRRKYFIEANLYAISKKEIAKLYASPCFYCGSIKKIQADHVMPISRGGKHSIGNLVPACQPCNLNKKDKTIMEWRNWKNG